MKKKIAIVTIICGLASGVLYGSTSCAAYENTTVAISIDGETISQSGRIINGTTMAPMEALLENLGMNVNYEANKGVAYATNGKTVLTVDVNEGTILKNDEAISLSVKPQLISDTVYIPLSETVEAIGASVSWDTNTKSISIQSESDSEIDESWKGNTGTIDLDSMTASGDGVEISGNVVKISESGDFEIKGTLTGGMIYVNCEGKVKLRLSGVNISNDNGPAIFAENSKKLLITLTEGIQNTLSDSSEYSEEYDAKGTLFSNDDIEIKGAGSLTVNAKYGHAIASDDNIKIENGNITLNSESGDGIHANDGIKLKGGNITVTSKGDGIQSEGYIEVYDGDINITTNGEVTASKDEFGGRMMQGSFGDMQGNSMPQDGERMQSSGFGRDMQNSDMPQNDFGSNIQNNDTFRGGFGRGMQDGNMFQSGFGKDTQSNENVPDDSSQNDDDNDSVSSKGIKADGALTISGGNITINSTDTAVKGDYIAIENGTLSLNSSVKKGIKAMGDLFINNGTVKINSYDEGIESKKVITVNGGEIDVTSNEDGINAGGNTGMGVGRSTDETNAQHSIVINGGTVKVDSKNDGLDSNGSLIINGGYVLINGPTSGADSAFDTDGSFIINGGYVLGVGSIGMVESPGSESAQNVLNIAFESAHSANSEVSVKDDDGNILFTFTPSKQYQSVIFSSDNIAMNKTYTATSESESISANTSENITAIGNVKSGFGGRGGMMQGGNFQEGNMPQGGFGGRGGMMQDIKTSDYANSRES